MKMERKQKKSRMSNINSELPPDMIHVIFSKLSILDLHACEQVCKTWKNLVSTWVDPNLFIAFISDSPSRQSLQCIELDPKHLGGMKSVASLSFPPNYSSKSRYCYIVMVNSCRGLLCYFVNRRNKITLCILNPMTNEYIQLPSFHPRGLEYCYGFGYSPKTMQYKIARHSAHESRRTLVEIFSFGTTRPPQWTPIGYIPLDICTQGAYFNGALYWVGTHLRLPQETDAIYRLDLEDYKLEQFSLPQVGLGRGCTCDSFCFGTLNGAFYLTHNAGTFGTGTYQVWQMEQDSSSWIKVFVIPEPHLVISEHIDEHDGLFHLQLIKVCEDGKILCLCAGLQVILYDPTTGMTQILTDHDLEIKKHLEVFSIDSFHFDSLHKVLAGDG